MQMNKSLVYKVLYYVSFVFTLGLTFFLTRLDEDLYFNRATNYQLLMIVINVVLVIIFSVKLRKYKLDNVNIVFPIKSSFISNFIIFSKSDTTINIAVSMRPELSTRMSGEITTAI